MPKITNKEYLQFKEGFVDLITEEQFNEWLEGIASKRLPRKCTIQQARALFITLFYTGRRPSELANIQGKSIKKVKVASKYVYQLDIKTLKGGLISPISLPINERTKEMYEYIRGRPPEMYAFWAFRKENKNVVKWKTSKDILVKNTLVDGTNTMSKERYVENKVKSYVRNGKLVNDYSILWTGRPSYWFRHHRFSAMYAAGATDAEVQLFKGAKSPDSVNAYKHMSSRMARNIVRTFKF
jgi:site-specific recombinase XerD